MNYTSNEIEKMLEQYCTWVEQKTLLEYELSHPVQISETEYLETLAYQKTEMNKAVRGGIPSGERNMRTALRYRDEATHENRKVLAEIAEELWEVNEKINRLNFYIQLLTTEQGAIIRLSYFEKKTWSELESNTGLSRRTIIRRKNDALKRLAEMYNYMEGFHK